MRSSTAVITDDDEAATTHDDGAPTTEACGDVGSKEDADEFLPPLKSTPFHQGEKVLAYYCRLIFEAKGWNKKWDEWLGMDCLYKHNKENFEKLKTPEIEHPLEKLTKLGPAFLMKLKNPNVTRGRKRKRISKGTASYEGLINVQIPPTLKKHLVNDCVYVTHMGKLVKLPCLPDVDRILKLYLEHQSNVDGRGSDSAADIINGLRCYFDKALSAMLLYKGERQQYEEATANGISPSNIYGAEHLLRLLVKLPDILYHANIEEGTLMELLHKLEDILKFLQRKQRLFFLSTYETPGSSCKIE